ncbi:hypothetical protein OQJ13_02390 [Legionella sp. PATHC035]|uniref:hypothetical protein n=1 Tax=Legionella sp. PATHC035 TaxID=2992040 RepID=UPI00224391EC|nr:hypothetical protein [Legionella sp. PATHC035]MCW8407816.1 hypothetical protein [Legionella sp. PATHC035]
MNSSLTMNKSLVCLINKLNKQFNDLDLHLHAVQHQKQELEHQIQHIEEQIDQTIPNSLTMNPEIEINWLNFVMQQQERKEAMTRDLKNCHELESKLNEKITRVKMELKTIEHYLQREADHPKKRA